jgi:hypothetical protein
MQISGSLHKTNETKTSTVLLFHVPLYRRCPFTAYIDDYIYHIEIDIKVTTDRSRFAVIISI